MPYYNNTSNVPCKYFQQGKCTRGNSCKFAHVYSNNGPKQDQGNSMSEADLYKSFINSNSLAKIEKNILSDLKDAESFQVRPLSSAYSYGTPCAVNLINDRDYSQEESRLQFYHAQLKGTINQYDAEMKAREQDMEKCFTHIRSHPDWAARFLQKNTKELTETGQSSMKNGFINFPLDLSGQAGGNTGFSTSFGGNPFIQEKSAFGNPTSAGTGATGSFAQMSNQGVQQAFGTGADASSSPFGGTNQAIGGVFGKPSFGGKTSTSGFGAGSANASNAFGSSFSSQPVTSTGSVFGKPQFGAGQSTNAFSSAFGKPAFGSSSLGNSTGSTFGGSAVSSSTFGSGQNNAAVNSSASPFGSFQNSATTSTSSPFASLQNNTASNSSISPFGSLRSNTSNIPTGSPFGSLQNKTTSSSTTSPFASLQNTSNPKNSTGFGTIEGNKASTTIFGQGASENTNAPFGTSNSAHAFGTQSNPQPTFANVKPATFGTTPTATFGTGSPFTAANNMGATGFGSSVNTSTSAAVPNSVLQRFVQGMPSSEETVRVEDLDKQTLEQFESVSFTLGKVPDVPPPITLIS